MSPLSYSETNRLRYAFGRNRLGVDISQATTCAPKNLFCSTRIAAAYAMGNPGRLGQINLRDYTESPNRSYFTF